MNEIPDESIRLIITSPPYFKAKDYGFPSQIGQSSGSYNHYIQSMIPVWKECFRVLKPNGKLCINTPILPMEKAIMNTHHNRDYQNINNDIEASILHKTKFFRYDLIIWDKGSTDQLMMGSYPYPPNFYGLNTIEFINLFVKDGQPEKMSKQIKEDSRLNKEDWREYINNIWRFSPEKDRSHPAPFPEELPHRLIRMFSFLGDTILDPFMGSGTTAVAAKKLGRDYVGYELNKIFIAMTAERLNQI
ncbi:MAG: site-specific DNA-methyltransferase [Candidatus Marinimicrobia bacterium]|jgi:site-specific DNA-methyltransferase (cytosine-N4-specific)|nr:site-specific DNA-methyltransferase [Candidatus Neomarinimicrobiota bacterium]MBT3618482.1 site-specific DNA-methyltransferase [Candidatus Neomarinimicrobiota bacterium]MBT3828888.1 site-specific DNA-methyltransferase [Candidatus Neomarinimicrobiota bacterium]MBT3997272.1 site-specific DNA-methyltransferase [Candidatus Neomarinimicrobiota bacterium]MBT4281206.1 site-specific DNA-methyltransferase [Candidatus Neomarinimicrobiota bacterium]